MTELTEQPRREFVHASYSKDKVNFFDDLLTIKEYLHYPDGRVEPNLRLVKNFKRTFYLTKNQFRDHEQKKEYEYIDRLEEHHCTQAEMVNKIKRALGLYKERTLSEVSECPYLYGTFPTTPVLAAEAYKSREPNLFTPAKLAVLDFETDVANNRGDTIISGILSCKENVKISAVRYLFKQVYGNLITDDDIIKGINSAIQRLCPGLLEERNAKLEIELVDRPSQVVMALMRSAHEWKPDYIGIWNIASDVRWMMAALKEDGIPYEDVFCDPSIPKEFKRFWFREDKGRKQKANGEVDTKAFDDLWHSVDCPASFQFVCMMALFKTLRPADGKRSMKLDDVLADYTDRRKLHFEGAAGVDGLDYHILMQSKYAFEYMAYQLEDGINPEILDETTRDVSYKLRNTLKYSELARLKSTPTWLGDQHYFRLRAQGKIQCSVSGDMGTYLDNHTPSVSNWIITLRSDLQYQQGVRIINEFPNLETNIVTHCADSDVKSCYPTADSVMNASKTTNMLEVCSPMDGGEYVTREAGVNMTAIRTNALRLAKTLYDFPDPDELLEAFKLAM